MNAPLPGPLNDNPHLDRWVAFPSPGKVTVLTGRVELGQGVLTAMAQIAADELDVAMDRITIRSGDTEKAPNEGYTAGSQSIQFGGVALRQACADVRALFLDQAAKILGCKTGELSIRDGRIFRNGTSTGQDYWTLSGAVDLNVKATGGGERKRVADLRNIGTSIARVDLPGKIFGESAFIHDMHLDGMVHARVVRQPNRGATIGSIDESAIRRAAKGPVEFVRNGNFLAIIGDSETAVEAAGAAAVNHVTWQNVEAPTPTQQEASWLLQRPVVERVFGAPDAGNPQNKERFEATYTRGYIAHASISPSCGLAVYRDGTLTVWTHCQGVYPLRAALAKVPQARTLLDRCSPRTGIGLLRSQWRRRRCRRCRDHRHAEAGTADTRALAPRGRVHLRAENAGHDRQGPCLARRCRQARRLDAGNLESNPQSTAGRRRKPARRARAARSAARTAAKRCTGSKRRRRHTQRRAALQHSRQAHPAPPGDGSAGANLGAARARGNAERVRARMLH